LLLATPPVVAAAVASLAILVPGPIYRTISLLPGSVAEPARAGLDLFVLYSAPRRDGLRWIDVGDPKLRKVDKLPTKPRYSRSPLRAPTHSSRPGQMCR